MVSFSCESCGDVLTKKKLDPHRNRCHGASFTCIDCMVHFQGVSYRSHTSCISESQKYQGALYKDKNNNDNNRNRNKKVKLEEPVNPAAAAPPVFSTPTPHNMSHRAYVEELPDEPLDISQFLNYEEDTAIPPAAPSPPSARPLQAAPNVFEYMVGMATPNLSTLEMPQDRSPSPGPAPQDDSSNSHVLVPFDFEANGLIDPQGVRNADGSVPFVKYGSGDIPTADETDGNEEVRDQFKTPAPRTYTKPRRGEESAKKDKKRKRGLHIDTKHGHTSRGDEEMTDAPPVLHSGLTGGLGRLNVFPPSPDYSGSGGEAPDPSPSNPIKKKKKTKRATKHASHAKHTKVTRPRSESTGILSFMGKSTTSTKTKTKKRKTLKSPSKPKKATKPDTHIPGLEKAPAPKLLEYKKSWDGNEDNNDHKAMVVYQQPDDLFKSLVTKGPDSKKGCSLHKVLKKFAQEKASSTDSLDKDMTRKEEKEFFRAEEQDLFHALRMRKNEKGEIVIFFATEV